MDTIKNEVVLREWLARRLKMDDVPEPLWVHLVERRYVQEVLDVDSGRKDEREARDSVLREAQALLRFTSDMQRTALRADLFTEERLSGPADAYAAVRIDSYASFIASEAKQINEVRSFRTEILGGRTLDPDEAVAFLNSRALQSFRASLFRDYGVPFLGHNVEILEENVSRAEGKVGGILRVSPPGVEWPVNYWYLDRDDLGFWRDEFPRGNEKVTITAPALGQFEIRYHGGSVIYDLCRAAKAAARRDLEVGQAVWLILTGQPPGLSLVSAAISTYGVRLTARPWASVQTVSSFYQECRSRFVKKGQRTTMRNLQVYHFVVSREDALGTRPSWRRLMKEWNEKHGEKAYKDVRLFARDFQRAEYVLWREYHGVVMPGAWE